EQHIGDHMDEFAGLAQAIEQVPQPGIGPLPRLAQPVAQPVLRDGPPRLARCILFAGELVEDGRQGRRIRGHRRRVLKIACAQRDEITESGGVEGFAPVRRQLAGQAAGLQRGFEVVARRLERDDATCLRRRLGGAVRQRVGAGGASHCTPQPGQRRRQPAPRCRHHPAGDNAPTRPSRSPPSRRNFKSLNTASSTQGKNDMVNTFSTAEMSCWITWPSIEFAASAAPVSPRIAPPMAPSTATSTIISTQATKIAMLARHQLPRISSRLVLNEANTPLPSTITAMKASCNRPHSQIPGISSNTRPTVTAMANSRVTAYITGSRFSPTPSASATDGRLPRAIASIWWITAP